MARRSLNHELGLEVPVKATRSQIRFVRLCVLVFAMLIVGAPTRGQGPAGLSEATFAGLKFRSIGPATMGGRIDDFAVLETNPAVFYVATATGGLWKTINNGTTWEALFEDQEVVSIGDVAIPADDANLVWVGSGENNNRQSSSWGDGVYKSIDGGHTWKLMGLLDTRHVARIVIDPVDHDVVYVAALGHLWGPNKERGVYKTTDGGVTWTNVLFVDEDTGATELVMDPTNNKVLYAATYQRRRSNWGFNGGGPGSALYKSSDAGKTWAKLTKGIPEGPLGRIGLDIYRKDPNVVYARIEHEKESGVYRSDDAGASWKKMSSVNPRPMYFSQIRIDPTDDHRIYVLGTELHISDDGGRTFIGNTVPHSDHHALWIDPSNSNHVLTGCDGGVNVSWDRGAKWDFIDNLDIGQFYHVGYDMDTPYHVYGGLQDNASWGGPSAVRSRLGIGNFDWINVGAGDGFVTLVDPTDSRIIYAESQGGNIIRIDRTSHERKTIKPQSVKSEPPLRWNWDTPIQLSPHNPSTVFVAANKVFKSTDRGHAWNAISPDLTARIDREELSLMGAPAKDFKLAKHDGVSSYGTLVAFAESPKKAGLYYAGADDGTVHVSRDDGANWINISARFPGLPKNTYVSRVAPSAFDEGTVYATFDNHREDDYRPYVYVSTDSGNTWRSIASTLPPGQVVRTITEDLKNPNVLYLGTEFGLFVTLDRGGRWTRVRANLPTVPIFEITLHPRDNDMLLATHGRSIWILDDITPFQKAAEAISTAAYLFETRSPMQYNPDEFRPSFGEPGDQRFWGRNPDAGAALSYYLREAADRVTLTIRDASGTTVREVSGDSLAEYRKAGINRVQWDLRYQPLPAPRVTLPRVALAGGGGAGGPEPLAGPFVLPGEYRVTLAVNGRDVASRSVKVAGDALMPMTDTERRTWRDTALALHALLRTANEAADAVGMLSEQLAAAQSLLEKASAVPPAVQTAVGDVDKEMAGLRRRLGVPSAGQVGGFGGPGATENVRRQIALLKLEVMLSTTLPTETQTRQAREAQADLVNVIEATNSLITSAMPALYKTLADNNLLLAPVKPIKAIATSPLEK